MNQQMRSVLGLSYSDLPLLTATKDNRKKYHAYLSWNNLWHTTYIALDIQSTTRQDIIM